MARRFRGLALAFAAATFSSPAWADGGEAVPSRITVEGQSEFADGPVHGYRATHSRTFTRTDTPLKEVPASITVVPQSLMQDQAMQNLGDAFRYVPGALMHQGEGNRDQVLLRGNSTTADFFVDGVRDDAQVFRDLYNLERVEILKGPAGMAFGRGGAGGVVNRVTKRPVFDATAAASVTLGSHEQLRGTLDVGDKLGASAAWRLNAMAESAESFRDGADLKRYALNPVATLRLGGSTLLTAGYERQYDDRTADRGFPSFQGRPFDADPAAFFGNASQSNARSMFDSVYAALEHDLAGGWQLKNTFRATHYDKFYQNVYPGSAVSAAGTLTLSAYNNANRRTNVFNQTELTKRFAAGGLEHTLLAGLELGHQGSVNKRNTGFFGAATAITVPASAPFATATRFAASGTDADNEVRASIGAAYVQDQIAFSQQWKAIVGVRYDRFHADFDDRRTTTPAIDLARTDRGWSPRAGLIWLPDERQSYYASYSYAFLPSAEQLALATTTADLGPETAKNYEIGARWELRHGLTLSAAIFRLDRDDVRVADPLRPGFFVKTGQQRTEGFELGLQGNVTRDWQVFGGYAYLDGRITKPINSGTTASVASVVPAGSKIGLVPEHTLSLWNRVAFGGGWAAGLGLIHQSESFTSFTNSVKLPAFSRVDAAVYYTLAGGKTRLALNVENLLDKRYFPTVDGDNNISPGAPRTVRLTLGTTF